MLKTRISDIVAKMRTSWGLANETQRDHIRILVGFLALCMVLLSTYLVGKPYWRRWQLERALIQAQEFTQRSDYRSALLSLRRASTLGMDDMTVWRQVAALLSDLHSSEVLVARRNLVALAPSDLNLRFALVIDALRFGENELARDVVEGTPGMGRSDAAFHRMAAVLAYATGMFDQLEAYLAEFVAKDPTNSEGVFNLASLRLWSADAAKADAAKAMLMGLVSDRNVSVRASIELLKYVARTGSRKDADDLVRFLVSHLMGSNVSAPVGAGLGGEPAHWFEMIEVLKKEASTRSVEAAALSTWLSSLGMGREALVWTETLSPEIRHTPLMRMAELDLALAIDDMDRVRSLLRDESWMNMRNHTIDLAFAARWQDRNSLEAHGRTTWNDAVESASSSLSWLRILVRLSSAWGLEDAKLSALWVIVQKYPSERWACEALRSSYMIRRDTERLWQLYRLWAGRNPSNRKVVMSWLMLSILLDRADAEIHRQAKQIWQQDPTDPAGAVCYAASLRIQKQVTRAMGVMEALPESALSNARVALWRSVLLVDSGRGSEASPLLAGLDPKQLLEEEGRLLLVAGEKLRVQSVVAQPRKKVK